MKRILIVKLSSLGDIVHTIPLAAAVRQAFPRAQIDWLVDKRFGELVRLIEPIDTGIEIDSMTLGGCRETWRVMTRLRETRYDSALDAQGLLKSALLARLSGARLVIGFSAPHLRERPASFFYSDQVDPGPFTHVIERNLGLLGSTRPGKVGWRFPLAKQPSPSLLMEDLGGLRPGEPFAVLFPGTTWPSKRWPAERFGHLAQSVFRLYGIRSAVITPPDNEHLSRLVESSSAGAAAACRRLTIREMIGVFRRSSLMVAGDSGPLHIAAAAGVPVIALHGPTNPARNGPWSPDDKVLSRYTECRCRHRRRCTALRPCMKSITVEEVSRAVGRILAKRKMTEAER